MKIKSFNSGTLVKKHNHLEYIINKDLCHADNVSDFEYDLTKHNDNYFEIKEIKEEQGNFHIIYNIDEDYRSFLSVKKESRVLKLSIMAYLLELNPLKDEISVLHPENIYFKNIEDIKIGFRGHRLLPKPKINSLEQYKLLIMSTLSNYSYDKYYRNKFEALAKEKDNFLYKVNNAQNLDELREIVREELNNVQTEYLLSEKDRHKNYRKKLIYVFLSGLVVVSILSFLVAKAYTDKVNNNALEQIAEAEEQKELNTVYEKLYKGDEEEKEEAINYMKDNSDKFDKNELENTLTREKRYEELITYVPTKVAEVIEKLYSEENIDKIRELSFTFENNKILQLERQIIDDDSAMFSSGNEGFYEEQNKRLALKAVDSGYLSMAKSLNDKLQDDEVNQKIKEKEISNKEKEIAEEKDKDKKKKLEKELEELKK